MLLSNSQSQNSGIMTRTTTISRCEQRGSYKNAPTLMDFEDHFTSHSYRKLYWTSFESYVNLQQPSPECYPPRTNDPSDEGDNEDPSHNQSFEEFEEDEVAEDEVTISSDDKGTIMARASQVTDYRLRSSLYKNLTLWDFVAQIDKVKNTRKKMTNEDDTDSESTMPDNSPLSVSQIQRLLLSRSRTRPKCDLQPNHPIGPHIPRRDKKNQYPACSWTDMD